MQSKTSNWIFLKGLLALLFLLAILSINWCFTEKHILASNLGEKEKKRRETSQLKKHTFWVRFFDQQSDKEYRVEAKDILFQKNTIALKPQIKIRGSLILESPLVSAPKCLVRLPSSRIKARNENNSQETIDLVLSGQIGGKPLSTDFVNPVFKEGEVSFIIEGYLDYRSFKRGLSPGKYQYEKEIKLIVEFQ